jgi:uncharacterized protein
MSNPASALPTTARSRVRRQPDLAAYDRATIHRILDAGLVAHLGVVDGTAPFVLPVGYARVGEDILIHGSTASRAFKIAATGAPICLTVTLLDGMVFARSVFNSSMNYRSVVALGSATAVADEDKTEALRLLSERLAPGHWDSVRQPSEQELKATSVLRLSLDEATAKVSAGPPEDDADDVALGYWAGVVSLRSITTPAEPAPEVAPGQPVPAYVTSWRPDATI